MHFHRIGSAIICPTAKCLVLLAKCMYLSLPSCRAEWYLPLSAVLGGLLCGASERRCVPRARQILSKPDKPLENSRIGELIKIRSWEHRHICGVVSGHSQEISRLLLSYTYVIGCFLGFFLQPLPFPPLPFLPLQQCVCACLIVTQSGGSLRGNCKSCQNSDSLQSTRFIPPEPATSNTQSTKCVQQCSSGFLV